MRRVRTKIASVVLLLATTPLDAQGLSEAFTPGPLIEGQGPNALVPGMTPLPAGIRLKVSFDVSDAGEDGKANKTLVSAARFLNMHVRAGVDPDHVAAAVIAHGKAVGDLTRDAASTPNGPLVDSLLQHNARIIVCGQSAAAYGVSKEDLLPGVELALSAMTAHAMLQQDGYTLNPF